MKTLKPLFVIIVSFVLAVMLQPTVLSAPVGQGMGAVLTIANEQLAYTLSDRATYLARKLVGTELEILVEGDSRLFNPYGVIQVNPEKCPNVNAAGAETFLDWMTSLETQALISQFGVGDFGQSLFVPDSAAWRAAKQQ